MSKRRTIDENLIRVFATLCDEVGSEFSERAKKLVLSGDFEGYLNLQVDPNAYYTFLDYHKDNAVRCFLRKYPKLPIKRDLSREAEDKFFVLERENYQTNRRLSKHLLSQGPFETPGDLIIDEFLRRVKVKVSKMLGRLPDVLLGKFGKGATFSDRGRDVLLPNKMSSKPTMTSDVSGLTQFFWETAWGVAVMSDRKTPYLVRGNRFLSVPKDATKNRGICVEPSVNVFLQLAVGSHIKANLKRKFGIDLYEAQPIHRALARHSSYYGGLGTLDLSDASDRISLNLAKVLLPGEWFDLLDSLRSKNTLIRGSWHRNEKFSSMGNGFTFEVMTVILFALCWEACERRGLDIRFQENVAVFGDDIIAPTPVCKDLLSILPYLGLKVNEEKSFITGRFKESCGGDYLDGQAVRPYYVKEEPNEPQQWIAIANGIRRMGIDHGENRGHSNVFIRSWRRALACLPGHIRKLRGPSELGDLVIHDDFEHWYGAYPSGERRSTFRETPDARRFVRGLLPYTRPRKLSHYRPEVQLACALYGVPSSGVVPRGEVAGYKLKWVAIGY